jgi:hypothetical protein
MSFCKGITQSGSNADTLLSDAYIKGIRNVPWQDAFQAILKVPPKKEMVFDGRTPRSNLRIGASREGGISATTTN